MKFSSKLRKWSRAIHRDLSFVFTGMLLIYAISGIAMNHVRNSNPHYTIEVVEYSFEGTLPPQSAITRDYVVEQILQPLGEQKSYAKHYFPAPNQMKVFLKGGSSLVMNIDSQEVIYESIKPRRIIGTMARLHYNPGGWWTTFADIFAVALIIIILTGLVMVKGRRGVWGIGGVELLIGMAIPLAFIFLM